MRLLKKKHYEATITLSNDYKICEIKTIKSHTEQEMRKNFAGKYIANPKELPNGRRVTVFDKSSENWWEHSDIYTRKKDGKKAVNCGDGTYELNEVEEYLDTRYS